MLSLLDKYKHLFNFPLDNVDINQIHIYIEQNQFRKLQFEYGTVILLVCLKYCENIQMFEKCAIIRNVIKEMNEISSSTIENYEQAILSKQNRTSK